MSSDGISQRKLYEDVFILWCARCVNVAELFADRKSVV